MNEGVEYKQMLSFIEVTEMNKMTGKRKLACELGKTTIDSGTQTRTTV